MSWVKLSARTAKDYVQEALTKYNAELEEVKIQISAELSAGDKIDREREIKLLVKKKQLEHAIRDIHEINSLADHSKTGIIMVSRDEAELLGVSRNAFSLKNHYATKEKQGSN